MLIEESPKRNVPGFGVKFMAAIKGSPPCRTVSLKPSNFSGKNDSICSAYETCSFWKT